MVENKIVKVQKRNRAMVHFDASRIAYAVLRAAKSIGGFQRDFVEDINGKLFAAHKTDENLADFIADTVVICLNANPHHLIANFPPTIEEIQGAALHVLRSYGLINTADAYEAYRWGRHWLREGALTDEQFVGNGFPPDRIKASLEWNKARGCDTVAGLNEIVRSGKLKPLIEETVAVYEKSLDDAAAKMMSRINAGDKIRMLWVSGPSSSGKTTTTVKLTERLQKHGLKFLMLNLDDYFWALVEHPTDWINDRNFETPEALDIQLINQHLHELLDGKEIQKPVYSFKEGKRTSTKPVRLEKDQILLLDCLHGLYPPMTAGFDRSQMFRVYIETMNCIYEGDGTGKKLTWWTDVRLARRILRDVIHRNHSPLSTILHWHYVRAGELFCIIPLMGTADVIINGGMTFDWPAVKPYFTGKEGRLPKAEELEQYPTFLDAKIRYGRLKKLLDSVEGLTLEQTKTYDLIPGDSVVREFIGGSTVKIPHNE
jgi:uridine kinase